MKQIFFSFVFSMILGSFAVAAETHNEAQPISKNQFILDQRALFDGADSNFDGRVTEGEAAEFRFEQKIPEHEARFKELDIDYSGYLSYDEIVVAHEELMEKQPRQSKLLKEQLLVRYDLDENGTITSEELDKATEKSIENRRKWRDNNAERDFKNKDVNEDGTVSLEEYLENWKNNESRRIVDLRSDRVLGRDFDNDGIITRTENEEFIEKLFDHLDRDEDDRLSAGEQENNAFRTFNSINPRQRFFIPQDRENTPLSVSIR